MVKYKNGYRRDSRILGERYTAVTQVLNPLPEIGSRVVILEFNLKRSRYGILKRYVYSSNHLDVWNQPLVYEVVGYTFGINNPLEMRNKVQLACVFDSGYRLEKVLPSIWFATGFMRCVKVEN